MEEEQLRSSDISTHSLCGQLVSNMKQSGLFVVFLLLCFDRRSSGSHPKPSCRYPPSQWCRSLEIAIECRVSRTNTPGSVCSQWRHVGHSACWLTAENAQIFTLMVNRNKAQDNNLFFFFLLLGENVEQNKCNKNLIIFFKLFVGIS